MKQSLRNMSYKFQRLGNAVPAVAINLSSACLKLTVLGVAGKSAAGRVYSAGEAFERFTPAGLLEFLDPAGTEQAVIREKRQSAHWLVITRNVLLIAFILFNWLIISWMISQYQFDLATHPADASRSFLTLWQNEFNTGNLLLSFTFFDIVEASLLVLAGAATALAYQKKLQATLAGQKARTRLEEALVQLVPLLPPQSIPAATQTLVTQVDRALNTASKQMDGVATTIQESSDKFTLGVDTFGSTGAKIQQTTEGLAQSVAQMEQQTEELTQAITDIQGPMKQIAQISVDLQQLKSVGAAQQANAESLRNLVEELQVIARQTDSSSRDLIRTIKESDYLTREIAEATFKFQLEFQQRQLEALDHTQQNISRHFEQVVKSMNAVTQSLDQTSQTIQRIESITRSAIETIPHRLEDLRFSSFFPKVVQVESWQTLSVYSYIAVALQAVVADAARTIGQLGRLLGEAQARASTLLSGGVEITIIPACDEIQFRPERISFKWLQEWRPAHFRFLAQRALADSSHPIEITILAGPIIIASITIEIRFVSGSFLQESVTQQPPSVPPLQQPGSQSNSHPPSIWPPNTAEDARGQTEAHRYERVFASYSHKDTAVVLAYKDFCTALGITLDVNIDSLRTGKFWEKELENLIDGADIFQLFWSSRSAKSAYVRREWEYALRSKRGEGFIRPVYWEKDPPDFPNELAHLHFVYAPFPQLSLLRRRFYHFF